MANGNRPIDQQTAAQIAQVAKKDGRLTAVVIGGGVAGLTVAHELAERRFTVWVVESTWDVNRFGQDGIAIGGMARTQYVAVRKTSQAKKTSANKSYPGALTGTEFVIPPILFGQDPPNPVGIPGDPKKSLPQWQASYFARLKPGDKMTIIGTEPTFPNLRDLIDGIITKREEPKEPVKPGASWVGFENVPATKGEPDNDKILLVVRSRVGFVSIGRSGLTAEGSSRLRRFVENLPACSELQPKLRGPEGRDDDDPVKIQQTWALKQLREALGRHTLLKPVYTDDDSDLPTDQVRLSTSWLVKTLELKERERELKKRKGEQKKREGHDSDGPDLSPDGCAALEELLRLLVPGDVVEIRVTNPNAGSLAVRKIRRALRDRAASSIVGVLAGLDANRNLIWTLTEALAMLSDEQREDSYTIPGEHGFRFFPAYYRHLRHTLERIPVFESGRGDNPVLIDKLSGRTVVDNLVNTPVQALVGGGTNPMAFPRTPSASPIALFLQLRDLLLERGYDLRDIEQFMLRVFRYMITGSLRREAEFEGLSWWEYLRGYDPARGTYLYQYSADFENDIGKAPRILAAFDAQWGDARSDGNTFVQLLLTHFCESEAVDQVLNAPTTEAWFEHWEKYLREYLDVTFVAAKVVRLRAVAGGKVIPDLVAVGRPDPDDHTLSDLQTLIGNGAIKYFVLATDAPVAEALTSGVPNRVGAAGELNGFTTYVRASPRGDQPTPLRTTRFGDAPWDRFQTLTGIQFYFINVTGIFNGHVYFMDAPWALSSINQQQFWRLSPIERGAPYQSVLSADIGSFDDPWDVGAKYGVRELATRSWKQIPDALRTYWGRHRQDPLIQNLDDFGPDWFHLDKNIEIGGSGTNHAPYLIPMVCDWQNRPKDTLWDPGESPSNKSLRAPTAALWHAPWGGYRVHWGQWVFAGTYLRHFTRMTTMEAANESGRHAVNAILDHLTEETRRGTGQPIPQWGDEAGPRKGRYHTGGNPLDPRAAYVPTLYGDYCFIWDPEKYELADFVPLRDLDDWLFEQGLPHVWDLTGKEVLPSLISYLPTAHEMGLPSFNDILRALTPPFTPPPGAQLFPWEWKP